MIRETATRKISSGFKGLLMILAMTVLIIVLSTVIGYVEKTLGAKNLEYIMYGLLLVLAFFVIQFFVTQYRYSLFDDELILEKMLGKKITPVVNVFIWDILSFEKNDSAEKVKITKSYKLFSDSTNKWSLIYKNNNEIYEAIFSPSEEFVKQLLSAIDNRQHKEQREPNIIT